MATTYKLYQASVSDGAVYIDLPVTGKVTSVAIAATLAAGAGGIGNASMEISRQGTNQCTTSNPRGVLCCAYITTSAASTGSAINARFEPMEPVKSGERLYLNMAGQSANVSSIFCQVFLTIS